MQLIADITVMKGNDKLSAFSFKCRALFSAKWEIAVFGSIEFNGVFPLFPR